MCVCVSKIGAFNQTAPKTSVLEYIRKTIQPTSKCILHDAHMSERITHHHLHPESCALKHFFSIWNVFFTRGRCCLESCLIKEYREAGDVTLDKCMKRHVKSELVVLARALQARYGRREGGEGVKRISLRHCNLQVYVCIYI